jgi:ABC-type transporter Mla subunit MlaD
MGDVAELRRMAATCRAQADALDGVAGQLRASLGVRFVSDAADRYRAEIREEVGRTEGAARQLRDAAQALDAHADAVEQRLEEIAAIQRWFADRVEDARDTLRSTAAGIDAATDELREEAGRLIGSAATAPAGKVVEWIGFARKWGW